MKTIIAIILIAACWYVGISTLYSAAHEAGAPHAERAAQAWQVFKHLPRGSSSDN